MNKKPFWLSWIAKDADFTIPFPWWVSGFTDDTPIVCCAVWAQDEEKAKQIIKDAHFVGDPDIEFRFCEEKAPDWSPFCDRFPRADWMIWWNDCPLEDALRAEVARLREALTDIRDLARTGMKPDVYPTEESWNQHKIYAIAADANNALKDGKS